MKKLSEYEDTKLEPIEITEIRNKLLELLEKLYDRESGEGIENYTNGYRYGHTNGQIELIEWILKIDKGEVQNENS